MAKVVFFRQCLMAKPTPTGEFRQVSWIPEAFAVVGKTLKLRTKKVWDNGWVVQHVGQNRLAESNLMDFHEVHKSHLRATGDAQTARKK